MQLQYILLYAPALVANAWKVGVFPPGPLINLLGAGTPLHQSHLRVACSRPQEVAHELPVFCDSRHCRLIRGRHQAQRRQHYSQ